MIRRFVNLIAEGRHQGEATGVYSLHRLDVAKHLFYPSTAEAEAANVNEDNNGGGSGDNKRRPTKMEPLRRLPTPSLRFKPFPSDIDQSPCASNVFAFLRPRRSGSEGRIVHISTDGCGLLYDADSHSTSTMPSLDIHELLMGNKPISITVDGSAGENGEKECRLYMMSNHSPLFQVLDFNKNPRKWQPLPPPPFPEECYSPLHVKGFAVVNGGRTIAITPLGKGTYCFDMASCAWSQAGDWDLPFSGRAEYVPELGAWLGISSSYFNYLCASSDLSVAIDTRQEPTVQHVWQYFNQPLQQLEPIVLGRRFGNIVLHSRSMWSPTSHHLVNLGSGRFCIAEIFEDERSLCLGYEEQPYESKEFAVLTGIEVLPGDNGEGGLRMVRHKSKRYMFNNDEIKWAL